MIITLEYPDIEEAKEEGLISPEVADAIHASSSGYEVEVCFEICVSGSFAPATLETPAEHPEGYIGSVSLGGEEIHGELRDAVILLCGGESDIVEQALEDMEENHRWEAAEARMEEAAMRMEDALWND